MRTNKLEYNDFLELKWKNTAAPLSEEKARALLTGMAGAGKIPAYANTLTTGLSSRRVKEALFREWGVHDIESSRHILGWLETEGSRELYRRYRPFISSSATAQECRRKAVLAYSEEACHEYIILPFACSVHSLYHCMEKMGRHPEFAFTADTLPSDILAWDMSRLILFVRLCLDCGYMGEQEAWEHILRAGGRIWRPDVSVRRFLMECLAGCAFCHYGDGQRFEECLSLAEKWSLIHNEASIV